MIKAQSGSSPRTRCLLQSTSLGRPWYSVGVSRRNLTGSLGLVLSENTLPNGRLAANGLFANYPWVTFLAFCMQFNGGTILAISNGSYKDDLGSAAWYICAEGRPLTTVSGRCHIPGRPMDHSAYQSELGACMERCAFSTPSKIITPWPCPKCVLVAMGIARWSKLLHQGTPLSRYESL